MANHVIFVGSHASKCLKAKNHPRDNTLQAFYSVEAAYEYLRGGWRPGDLVLLRGSDRDHVGEGILGWMTREDWRHMQHGGKARAETVRQPQNTVAASSTVPSDIEGYINRCPRPLPNVPPRGPERPAQAIVGLGNPGEKYEYTPHNVGRLAVNLLACSLRGKWTRVDRAMVADVGWRGEAVYLLRLLTNVNDSGPLLSQLGYLLGFRLAECILIHDDIDLPLGNVRTRMRGGDGGHKGVRSILQAFQTDVIRRVKIGVGRPTQKEQLACYVLTAFSSAERPIIDRACVEAADHTPEMVMSWTRIG